MLKQLVININTPTFLIINFYWRTLFKRWTSNIEHRTSNIEWKPTTDIKYMFFLLFSCFNACHENYNAYRKAEQPFFKLIRLLLLFFHSSFDVERSMFDVHLFSTSPFMPQCFTLLFFIHTLMFPAINTAKAGSTGNLKRLFSPNSIADEITMV